MADKLSAGKKLEFTSDLSEFQRFYFFPDMTNLDLRVDVGNKLLIEVIRI